MENKNIMKDTDSNNNSSSVLDCPVLQRNVDLLSTTFSSSPEIFQAIIEQNESAVKAALIEQFDVNSRFLGLYSDVIDQMKEEFSLTENEANEFIPLIEGLALTYIGSSLIGTIRPAMKDFHSNFVEIDDKLETATEGLDDKLDEFEIFLSVMSADLIQIKEYRRQFENLIAARNALKSLPEFIRQSPIVQVAGIDKAVRPTNWALHLWTEGMYCLWFGLGRTIINSNDGINGRKHLMDFLEFCMRPIHEAVEYETLDNMLRKVQKEVSEQGGLSDANFKLGNSSPLRVSWSNSES